MTNKEKHAKALTYEQIYQALHAMTTEQREHKAIYVGDEIGGYIISIEVLPDDQVNPSGDGMEPRTEWIANAVIHEGYTQEEAESEHVVARKGQPLLCVD